MTGEYNPAIDPMNGPNRLSIDRLSDAVRLHDPATEHRKAANYLIIRENADQSELLQDNEQLTEE
jgi:hypothetical protein